MKQRFKVDLKTVQGVKVGFSMVARDFPHALRKLEHEIKLHAPLIREFGNAVLITVKPKI